MTRDHHLAQGPSFVRIDSAQDAVFVSYGDEYVVIYAPRLACVVPRHAAERVIQQVGARSQADAVSPAARLIHAAESAQREATAASQAPFAPECLTLFLNNACNLSCRYCHAEPGDRADPPISTPALRAAGNLVAASCAKKKCAFTVAFHGGGEPSLELGQISTMLDSLQEIATRHGVSLRTYIATNGVMGEKQARWLAERFDLVGLSCDGPPDIQDTQRPARNGRATSESVARTADILRQAGTPFHVRATITRPTLERQPEITRYIIDRFAPGEVRLESVYRNPTGKGDLLAADAPRFTAGYQEARRMAAEKQTLLTTSLVRPDALFGRHCNVLRHVLNLAPGDVVTGCFLESRESGAAHRGVLLGRFDEAAGLGLDAERMKSLANVCSTVPAACAPCLCCYQCTRGCPDVCAIQPSGQTASEPVGGFRCEATRMLMEALVLESAAAAWHTTPEGVNREVQDAEISVPVAVFRGLQPEGGPA